MNTIICPFCGSENPSKSRECSVCGANLDSLPSGVIHSKNKREKESPKPIVTKNSSEPVIPDWIKERMQQQKEKPRESFENYMDIIFKSSMDDPAPLPEKKEKNEAVLQPKLPSFQLWEDNALRENRTVPKLTEEDEVYIDFSEFRPARKWDDEIPESETPNETGKSVESLVDPALIEPDEETKSAPSDYDGAMDYSHSPEKIREAYDMPEVEEILHQTDEELKKASSKEPDDSMDYSHSPEKVREAYGMPEEEKKLSETGEEFIDPALIDSEDSMDYSQTSEKVSETYDIPENEGTASNESEEVQIEAPVDIDEDSLISDLISDMDETEKKDPVLALRKEQESEELYRNQTDDMISFIEDQSAAENESSSVTKPQIPEPAEPISESSETPVPSPDEAAGKENGSEAEINAETLSESFDDSEKEPFDSLSKSDGFTEAMLLDQILQNQGYFPQTGRTNEDSYETSGAINTGKSEIAEEPIPGKEDTAEIPWNLFENGAMSIPQYNADADYQTFERESLTDVIGNSPSYQRRMIVSLIERVVRTENTIHLPVEEKLRDTGFLPKITFLILAIAGILVFLLSGIADPFTRNRQTTSAAVSGFQEFAKGTSEDAMIVIDYSPAYASELSPAVEVLIRDLRGKGIEPVIAAVNPASSVLIRNMGEKFTYLPANAVSIRERLAEKDIPGTVFLFTTEISSVRIWADQLYHSGIRLALVTSSQISPLAQPYIDSGMAEAGITELDDILAYGGAESDPREKLAVWYLCILALISSLFGFLVRFLDSEPAKKGVTPASGKQFNRMSEADDMGKRGQSEDV